MTLSKDKAGALAFLVLAIAYGIYAQDIPMYPGDENEPFNAKTMPNALAWLTGATAFLMLVLPSRNPNGALSFTEVFRGLNWAKTLELLGLMALYGFTIKPLGFVISTILFLIGSIWALGERRMKVIFLTAVPLTIGFWVVLSQLLGIYLSPGELYLTIMGGNQ